MVFAWKWDTSISNGLWSVSHFSTDYSWGISRSIPIRFPLIVGYPSTKKSNDSNGDYTNQYIYIVGLPFIFHLPVTFTSTRVGINLIFPFIFPWYSSQNCPMIFPRFSRNNTLPTQSKNPLSPEILVCQWASVIARLDHPDCIRKSSPNGPIYHGETGQFIDCGY